MLKISKWLYAACLATAVFTITAPAFAEDRDELVFIDGERLVGHFEKSDADNLIFRSDMAGEITVAWSKVKELHTSLALAVVPKGVEFGRHRRTDAVAQGKVAVVNQSLTVATPSGARDVAVRDTSYIVDEATFQNSFKRPGLFQDWKGSATAGVSLVLATEDNRSYSSAISLVRAIPTEPWLKPENKTSLEFSSAFGELTQPGQPVSKTSIYHADGERDEYFSQDFYTFGEAAFDHNYSQGLDLQQTIGGGLGWTVIRGASETFDLKAELSYISQKFQIASENQNLVGSVFSEGYNHKYQRGFTLHESLSASPAWSNLRAYSATADVVFTIPISTRFNVSLNALDTFLNNPSPGFRKNSFQYTTGLNYVLK